MSDWTKFWFVLVDLGDKLNKKIIPYYTTEGRHYDIQMIVKCYKPAQIDNMAKIVTDTFYMSTFYWTDLFKNFKNTDNFKHNFREPIDNLSVYCYNCQSGIALQRSVIMI